jgi:hypothetical protein
VLLDPSLELMQVRRTKTWVSVLEHLLWSLQVVALPSSLLVSLGRQS